jgi:hypothetical protein
MKTTDPNSVLIKHGAQRRKGAKIAKQGKDGFSLRSWLLCVFACKKASSMN